MNDVKTHSYTVREVAFMLNVTPNIVRRLIREKKLQGVKLGGAWVVPAESLYRLMTTWDAE